MLLPDAEVRGFIFTTFRWLLSGLGGLDDLVTHTPLVTPTLEDFPVYDGLEGHALVTDYFAFVREHARAREAWRFELVEARPPVLGDSLAGAPRSVLDVPVTPHGEEPLPIGYPMEALRDPAWLIALLAQGISHYLVNDLSHAPKPEAKDLPGVADLGGVFLGFGIFFANTAFTIERREGPGSIGWTSHRRWTLTEREFAYALAVFGWLKEIPDVEITRHLRPNPRAYYGAAVRDLRKRDLELRELGAERLRPHEGPYR